MAIDLAVQRGVVATGLESRVLSRRPARHDDPAPGIAAPSGATGAGPESDPHNPLFRQAGLNYLKGRLRSRQDVARRYHADLLKPFGIAPTEQASAY